MLLWSHGVIRDCLLASCKLLKDLFASSLGGSKIYRTWEHFEYIILQHSFPVLSQSDIQPIEHKLNTGRRLTMGPQNKVVPPPPTDPFDPPCNKQISNDFEANIWFPKCNLSNVNGRLSHSHHPSVNRSARFWWSGFIMIFWMNLQTVFSNNNSPVHPHPENKKHDLICNSRNMISNMIRSWAIDLYLCVRARADFHGSRPARRNRFTFVHGTLLKTHRKRLMNEVGALITQISACGLLDGSSRTVWNSVIEYYSTFFPCGATKSNGKTYHQYFIHFSKGTLPWNGANLCVLFEYSIDLWLLMHNYDYGTGTIYL